MHGSNDAEKDDFQKDSAAVDMMLTWLLLSPALLLPFEFSVTDIRWELM